MIETIRAYIKKYKIRIIVIVVLFCAFFSIYFYISSYLEEVLNKNLFKNRVDAERSVTGDEIALTYTKDNGVVISYSAQRTQTEDDTDIIQSYFPRLIYHFAQKEKDPVYIKADFGTYSQKEKIVIFEQNVVVQYANSIVKAPLARFIIDEDRVIFPNGAVIEDVSVIKTASLDWNITTNTTYMEYPTIYINSH